MKKIQTANSTLTKWIISGCIILMIPMMCILANYIYTKELITRKIQEANQSTLNSSRYSIDSQLQSLFNASQYMISNPSFYGQNTPLSSDTDYLSYVRSFQNQLKTYKQVNSQLDILVYFPERDYIITPENANTAYYTYHTIRNQPGSDSTGEHQQWIAQLEEPAKNQFFISKIHSYSNFGKDSIVFSSTSPFVYRKENIYQVFASVPCDFIYGLVDNVEHSSFLILDKNGTILKQFGEETKFRMPGTGETPPYPFEQDAGITSLEFYGNTYIYSYAKSKVSDWYYAVCTPDYLYLKEANRLRNLSVLTIFLTLLLSIVSIVLLQIRNYRPIDRLVRSIPTASIPAASTGAIGNEFQLIEAYYQSLYRENYKMRSSIQSRQNYAREMYLLSKLKGRGFHLSDEDMTEYLNVELQNKQFALVSFYVNDSNDEMSPAQFDLMAFSIDNVIHEMFGEHYTYERIIDEIFFVYLFSFDDSQSSEDRWQGDCTKTFQEIYEFFETHFHIRLSVTAGALFRDFEALHQNYSRILDAFQYRYVIGQYGVLSTETLETMDFTPLEQLKAFRHQFNLSLIHKDCGRALELSDLLFKELDSWNKPFIIVRYHVISIVSELLFTFQNAMSGHLPSSHLDSCLKQLSVSDDAEQAQKEFQKVLKLLCSELTAPDIFSADAAAGTLVTNIKAYVETHYNDCNMNISTIAQAMELTPKYMSKLFKEATSEGLLNYINAIRIHHAKKLMQETNETIDEIAAKTGFTNSRSFRRNFLKITGMNPTDFRK